MMLAIEEMQTQIRAENGVQEKIVGYVGRDWNPDIEDLDISEFAGVGAFKETDFDDLPSDIQDIVKAEMHRMKTGEVVGVEQFKDRNAKP
jgi:hypothetical protein